MKTFLSNLAALFVAVTMLFAGSAQAMGQTAAPAADPTRLEADFLSPPASARPWVYWFWNNGNVTKAGITADLEAMQRVGIGGVLIMDVVERFAPPPGPADFMNAQWQELFHFAVTEAARLGLEINMTNGPGWCGSSGPWITPELSMQKLVTTAVTAEGPSHFSGALPISGAAVNPVGDGFNSSVSTGGYYRDIAVLAYPQTANGVVPREQVVDLSSKLDSTGRLEWNVPNGKWIIQRIGHASTGSSTRPPVKGGNGLECDKLSREAMDVHFQNMMGKLIARADALAGPTLSATHIDSWEVGAQNWTAKFADEFHRRRGYNPIPFLPNVISPGQGTNPTVGSPPLATRFRWDFAQTVSELLAENYAGRLAELAHAHHLRLSIEGYHLPFGDEATYTARADEPMTEFWATGSGENLAMARQMASVAHVMGHKIVGAEAFTSGDNEQWKYHPATVKALGDYEFSQGVNRFVVHRYAHQPYLDRFPGVTMGPWGLHYERTQTWWEMSGAWHQYLARCQYLLRQGRFVADLCYLRPEQGDQTEFNPAPAVPAGYRYDECSAGALLARMSVRDGRLTLPDGMSYRVLVLPDNHGLMTPALLARIKGLVADGATVLGSRPTASPSLSGYPDCDQEVARLAAQLWGDIDGTNVTEHAFGKGKVISGRPLPAVLSDLQTAPDFLAPGGLNWIHRQVNGTDLYFVANPANSTRDVSCTFRVQGRQPELWDPETGQCSPLAVYRSTSAGVTVPLRLNGSGSAFVVFRSAPMGDPVLTLTRNDQPVVPAGLAAQVEIKRATYGVPGDAARTRDVRAKLQERAASGSGSIPVQEMAEGDDPAFGVVKTLVMEGTMNGKPFTIRGQDPETIRFPSAVAVEIKRATYGMPGDAARTRDVRARLQERVNGGADGMVVGELAEGDDPAFGVVKTLVVEGSIDGKPFTVRGQDPDTVYFAPAARASTRAAEVLIGAGGKRSLLAFERGTYVATTAAGQTLHAQATDVPAPLELTGAWELRFPPHWGAPEAFPLDQLISWTETLDEGVRHFSGTATYTKTFQWPPSSPAGTPPREYWLELGDVQVMARVKLNGHDLGVLWRPPFRTDITGALVPGHNTLEIAVANLWPNRMIADAALPSNQRLTWSTFEPFNKDTPLLPSGLLGPVTISAAVPVALVNEGYVMKAQRPPVPPALSVFPAAASENAAGRERLRFDDGWKFHLADAVTGTPPGADVSGVPLRNWRWQLASHPATAEHPDAARPDFNDSAWAVPASTHGTITTENTSAWFRTVLPAAGSARDYLHFLGADDNASVYLNGRLLARHSGWDEPFDVPLGPAWKDSGPNVLAVLVENVGGQGGLDAVYLQEPGQDASAETAKSGPAATGYDDKDWRAVQLPHDFIVEGAFDPHTDASHGFLPNGAGWYRKTFNLSMKDRGQTLWLEFDGVYRDSQVWLNGHLLGRHASGYTSFYYDISRFANYDADAANVLTVWADARQNEGWWYEGGGIYRHVYLTRLAPLHIAHWGTQIVATPSEDFTRAEVSVQVELEHSEPRGGNDAGRSVSVESALIDPEGRPVSAPVRTPLPPAAPDLPGTVSQRLAVEHPRLWSPNSPTLYALAITVRQGQEVVDRQETAVGIRSLHWDANRGFFLNGKPFKIQGTCNHQDFAGLGVALPDRVHYYKVEKLKEMGSNAFRFSHQPMAPELLDACDRLGMVVMDENRRLGDSPEILGQVESLVRRDRNHPSVILWSMCNEEGAQGTERGGRMFAAMKQVTLKWDKSRPVTCAMNGGFGSGISLVEDLQGFNYNTGQYDPFHARFPRQPCYGSETASETTTRGVYADDARAGFVTSHKTTAEDAWKPIAERPRMAGGFVWTGFDYRGEPTPYQWPCVNSHFGIMDTCGFPKDSYYYYFSEWGGKPVAHICAQWNHAGEEGHEIPVWVVGNAARYELFLNGASLGVKEMPAHRHLEWKVTYAPGTLEARGYDADGKTVANDRLETTGAPARLELVPDRSGFTADAEDVVMVRCNVLDARGRVVPLADNEVTFTVSGPARVVGVGNGNPSDHEPDKALRRHAFNGHCLVVVQSDGTATGDVTLTASTSGLPAASLTLHAWAAK